MLSAPQNSPPNQDIAVRLTAVRQRIAMAAKTAGRDVDSITLLAVSKGQSIQRLEAALGLGLNQFGENYVTEALPKISALKAQKPIWHFIGRLQGNKTRPIAEHFDWVHSLDRFNLAERLSAQRGPAAPLLNICVQVNVADESSKAGVASKDCLAFLHQVAALPRLRLRGLMCMLPYEAEAAQQNQWFAQMRELSQLASTQGLSLDTLSMGMSGDLEAAVAQGSTLLRIGTALFGARTEARLE
jgi:PLP dependent protein